MHPRPGSVQLSPTTLGLHVRISTATAARCTTIGPSTATALVRSLRARGDLLVNTNTRLWLRFPLLIPPQLRIDGQLHEPEHEHAQTDEGACVLVTEDLRAQLLADWLLCEPYF